MVLGILSATTASAVAIDAARLPPAGRWSPGIPGGIPTNYTQFCNARVSIPGSSLVAVGDGVTDDTAAINAALAACPDGQYVYLPEGNYRCNGEIGRTGVYLFNNIQRPFSVVLRGDGPTRTRIFSYASGDSIAFRQGLGPIGGGVIASGNTRGSTSIVAPLSAPSLFTPGKWILIRRNNDESGLRNTPAYMVDTASQFVRLTNLVQNGNGSYTVTFTPALNEGYAGDRVDIPCSMPYRCGIEDLYIERMTNTTGQNVLFSMAQECWVKNVESNRARKWHIRLNSTAGCEVRESFVHDAWDAGGDAGYGVGLFAYACNNLIEDNIGLRLRHAFILEYGGQNNVIAYNYSKDPINNDRGPGTANQLLTDYLMGDLTLHGGHPRWNLFEGNVGATLRFDYVLGGSDFNTAFRNRIQRKGLPSTVVANFGSDIQRGNHNASLVGNVYEARTGTPLRRWGTNQDDATNPDPLSEITAHLHGEFDLTTAQVEWAPGNPDRTLPASYYLTAKPASFGTLPWPAFGPDVAQGGSSSGIPAVPRLAALSNVAPTFEVEPQSASIVAGGSVTLTAIATGTGPISYQWLRNGVPVSGATDFTLTLANLSALTAGDYTVVATNSVGSTVSATATVAVTSTASAPTIQAQPQSQTVNLGGTVTFSVTVTGTSPLSYQWRFNGNAIPGATAATYVLSNVQTANAGSYSVTITNAFGTAQSANAVLTVNTNPVYFVGVAVDAAGVIYVTDAARNIVRRIASTGELTTIAGTAGSVGSADGAPGSFNQPEGIALDSGDTLYIADAGNALIRSISPSRTVTTLAGSSTARGNVDGTGTAATFNRPTGLAVDAAGNLYVADVFTNTIRRITPARVVTTLAGANGTRGDADGTGSAARFNHPASIAVDPLGNLYVADAFNHTIRKISPAGAVTTLAGLAGVAGYANGTGTAARFSQPLGVAVDPQGNVFVSDTGNSVVRRITPAGAVTTLAGMPGVAGRVDGPGSSAQFNQPHGLFIHSSGTVYVADTGNSIVRRVEQSGATSTVATFEPTPPPTPTPTPNPNPQPIPAKSGGGSLPAAFGLALAVLAFLRIRCVTVANSRSKSGS